MRICLVILLGAFSSLAWACPDEASCWSEIVTAPEIAPELQFYRAAFEYTDHNVMILTVNPPHNVFARLDNFTSYVDKAEQRLGSKQIVIALRDITFASEDGVSTCYASFGTSNRFSANQRFVAIDSCDHSDIHN